MVEVSAIVGSGRRDGVDMAWGRNSAFGHFGLDLIGDNGGSIRIENAFWATLDCEGIAHDARALTQRYDAAKVMIGQVSQPMPPK